MPPDGTATRNRLLRAAYKEFAQFGLAGARVDRIAETAPANKRSIYVVFGNKVDLFDIVLADTLERFAEAVELTPDDLADYAGRLYDYLLDHPEVLRLIGWAQLERPDPTSAQVAAYRPKVQSIADAQVRGVVTDSIAAVDVLALLLGLVTAWANSSPALRALADEPDGGRARLAAHRTAMTAAVQALVAPASINRQPVALPRQS